MSYGVNFVRIFEKIDHSIMAQNKLLFAFGFVVVKSTDFVNSQHAFTCILYHIEAETRWPTFSRWIFKWIFFTENCCILIQITLKYIPKGPLTIIQHYLDNGLTPNRRQAIIWNNDCLAWWCIYASLGLDRLRFLHMHWGNNMITSVPLR